MALYLGSNKVGICTNNKENNNAYGIERKDVNFFDYDGTLLYSYTVQEFNNLTVLPNNPFHEGLIAQGWNWTLPDIRTQITSMGTCDIGQMYITADGKTHLDIELIKGRTSPYLGIAVNGSVDIDWGDGTAHDTVTGSSLSSQIRTLHEYSIPGAYTIKIGVNSGSFSFYGTNAYYTLNKNINTANLNRVYANTVQSVKIGSGCAAIDTYAFYHFNSLQFITIPSNITKLGTYSFSQCYSLKSITIPNGTTSMPNSSFSNCYSMSFVSMPKSITSIGSNIFNGCRGIPAISIPSGATSISSAVFQNCYSLNRIVLPSGLTTFEANLVQYDESLTSLIIPDTVTNIKGNSIYFCYGLPSLIIPSSVTNIAARAFEGSYGLGSIHFKSSSPPAVANSNAFTSLPTDCKIYVPTGKLNDYKTASNYPDPNTYTYMEE